MQSVCKCSIVLGQTYRPDHSHYNVHHPTNCDVDFSVLNTKTVSKRLILSVHTYAYPYTKCLLGLCMLAIMSILRFSIMLRIISELLLNKLNMVVHVRLCQELCLNYYSAN